MLLVLSEMQFVKKETICWPGKIKFNVVTQKIKVVEWKEALGLTLMGVAGRPGETTAGHRKGTRKEPVEAAVRKSKTLIQNLPEKWAKNQLENLASGFYVAVD